MKDNSELRNKVKDYIASIKCSDDVYVLFRNLNYPKETIIDSSYVKKLKEFSFAKDEEKLRLITLDFIS